MRFLATLDMAPHLSSNMFASHLEMPEELENQEKD